MNRTWAEHLGGTRMKFHYPCGHSSVKDYSKGPVTRRMGEVGVRLMCRWWSKEKGGVTAPCPKCDPPSEKTRPRGRFR